MEKQYLIVGGGVIGLSIARSLLRASVVASNITLLEKEEFVGAHTSGRNSGVLHAGFYYASDSQKAKFCKLGNQQWTQFCLKNSIPIRQCGKLVVCKQESEVPYLRRLYEQGLKNNVELRMISMAEARSMEPSLNGYGKEAIFSPTTSVIDTKLALKAFKNELLEKGVNVKMGEKFVSANQGERFVQTNKDRHSYDFLINAAGLDSLEIAQQMGSATELKMVPIKGRYAISKEPGDIKMLVYPVPVEGAYVLGVHSTLTPHGFVKIGPTVFPAFGKENYDSFQGVSAKSLYSAICNYLRLVTSKKDRGLIWHFISKEFSKSISIQRLLNDAAKLQDMKSSEFEWYTSGIRPQLFCTDKKQLMNDFMWYKSGDQAIHLLNVVSPGWTCAMPFADHVVEELILKN